MDVQCARTFLQELCIRAESSADAILGSTTFLLNLHAMNQQEVSVTFRSAAQHFETGGSGNSASVVWIGKRDIPGVWVDRCDVTTVSSFVAVIQF